MLDLIAAVKIHNMDALLPHLSCPSGTYTEQSTLYTHGYENSKYPVLALAEPIFDNASNSISDGYYVVILSQDKKFLLLFQSSYLKAKIPVFKYEHSTFTQEEKDEEKSIQDDIDYYTQKGKYKKLAEAKDQMRKFKLRQEAKTYADIYDSKQGYYILKYLQGEDYAEAIIAK